MSHNMKSQLLQAVVEAQRYGESKRSAVRAGSGDWQIYSKSYAADLRDLAKSLGTYIMKEHPGCRLARNITPAILDAYVSSRAITSSDTIDKIRSQLVKLESACRRRYGRVDWDLGALAVRMDVTPPQRDYSATQGDYDRLTAAMRTGRSDGWKAVVLSRYAGCRVTEDSQIRMHAFRDTGGRHGYGQIVLSKWDGTKGGRPRIVQIPTAAARDALREICADVPRGDYIIRNRSTGGPLQPGSLNKALKRGIMRAGMDWDQWKQNGHHSFRKLFAQECYDLRRLAGSDRREALQYVNRQLGHGEDRKDDDDTYVHDQW